MLFYVDQENQDRQELNGRKTIHDFILKNGDSFNQLVNLWITYLLIIILHG